MTFTDENLSELLASGQLLVVDCWATWCGPCVRMAPVIDQLIEHFDGQPVIIGKYNVDEEGELAAKYRIMSIPTILFFKDGQLVDRMAGSQAFGTLEAKISSLMA